MSDVLHSAIPEAVLANADRLGLRTLLRPATVAEGSTEADVLVTFDGDTETSHVMTLIGAPAAGARVMCLMDPPHGAYVIGYLRTPAWTDYLPVWTSAGTQPVLNDGTLTGQYTLVGKLLVFQIQFRPGASTTFGTGRYEISVPFVLANLVQVGSAHGLDSGTSHHRGVIVGNNAADTFRVYLHEDPGAGWSGISPFTVANGDQFEFGGAWQIA